MRSIGVTGGVGSGKSVILEYLRDHYGARLIVADEVARQLEEPGEACYNELLELLGREVLGIDGHFDNKKFASAIFSDEKKLAAVNAIVHPEVKKYILSEMEKEEKNGCRYFIVEAALLIEETALKEDISTLAKAVLELSADRDRLSGMSSAAVKAAHTDPADLIFKELGI